MHIYIKRAAYSSDACDGMLKEAKSRGPTARAVIRLSVLNILMVSAQFHTIKP